jgi:hypothetical protein
MSDQAAAAETPEPSPVPQPPPPPPPSQVGGQHHGDDVCDSNDTSKLPPWHAPCPPRVGNNNAFVFDTGLAVKNSLTRTKVPFVTMSGTNQLTWYMYVFSKAFTGSCRRLLCGAPLCVGFDALTTVWLTFYLY